LKRVPLPVACTLEGNDARTRWEEWGELSADLLHIERVPNRLQLSFVKTEATVAAVSRLVDGETKCCSFVDWELSESADEVMVAVKGDVAGVDAMAAAFGVLTR
jgi:hypothetical protein